MNTSDELADLKDRIDSGFEVIEKVLAEKSADAEVQSYGTVVFVGSGTAEVKGMQAVRYEELIRFEENLLGIAFNVDESVVGVVLLGDSERISAGSEVRKTGRVLDVPVGEALLGRVTDARGRPLDGRGRLRTSERQPVERPAPEIMDRLPVTVPLQTGRTGWPSFELRLREA